MNLNRYAKPLFLVAVVAVVATGYVFLDAWLPSHNATNTEQPLAPNIDVNTTATKILVSDQAQKNLGLIAKPLQSTTFWKTIAVPGMIVDRPGYSDREVVAPAVGTVNQLFHVPGDTVRPGDRLFTLKLVGESLQQTQAELFKTSKNIRLAETRRDRLSAAGEAIAQARIVEVDQEISRLLAAAQTLRQDLQNRGLPDTEIDGIADGRLLSEITVSVPLQDPNQSPPNMPVVLASTAAIEHPIYEVQELKVELGQQVQAGQTLCHLSSHYALAIEGRAFRDETTLLERSVQFGWPVEVDFQEDAGENWKAVDQTFTINYLANTIDPVTRTFAFLMPLQNQYKTVERASGTQILWRFRPGQKVLLKVRIEKLDDVFVLPADAVVMEGADAYVFTQNVNTFERKSVYVAARERDRVVVANDGSLPTYKKGQEVWTIPAVARTAAAQLNRMAKAGSSGAPKGYHIHADGSLHKNEDDAK